MQNKIEKMKLHFELLDQQLVYDQSGVTQQDVREQLQSSFNAKGNTLLVGDQSTGQDSLETVADFQRNNLSNINSNNISNILSNNQNDTKHCSSAFILVTTPRLNTCEHNSPTERQHFQTQAKLISNRSQSPQVMCEATTVEQHDESYMGSTLRSEATTLQPRVTQNINE